MQFYRHAVTDVSPPRLILILIGSNNGKNNCWTSSLFQVGSQPAYCEKNKHAFPTAFLRLSPQVKLNSSLLLNFSHNVPSTYVGNNCQTSFASGLRSIAWKSVLVPWIILDAFESFLDVQYALWIRSYRISGIRRLWNNWRLQKIINKWINK